MTDAQLIKELMARYDEYRAKWISFHGTDEGYDQWFTGQVMRGKAA